MSLVTTNTDRLLLLFVHGFRGSSTSFKDFPNRLQTILSSSLKAEVTSIVFPSYKTAGELRIAVDNFSKWLCEQVSNARKEMDQVNNKGNIMIALLGHSFGGIVSAETILYFEKNNGLLLGAKIIGMLAYDTPFYSINQNFVTEKARSGFDQVNKEVSRFWGAGATAMTAATASRSIQQSSNDNSGSSKKWGLLAGVVGAAALGAAAYVARDKISSSLSDAYDELTFVSDLTDMHGQNER
ncbi:hypothetical protein K501DRAFT_184154 [Backusella circina FSU 941]|nr:hypothetical protein K501DRAFT_184154 [Backusella circina FSU 941]